MFDSGNIQSRPTPQLYVTGILKTRTWNPSPVAFLAALSEADYTLVTFAGQTPGTETAEMSAALTSAVLFAPIFDSTVAPVEVATLSASLDAAIYQSVLFLGADQLEAATLSAALSLATYEQVIFNSTAAPVEPATMAASLTQAEYLLV